MIYPNIDKVNHTIRDCIDIIIDLCPENAIIVESGTYWGNTAAFIVNKLFDAGKIFQVYTIDNFLWKNVASQQKQIDKVTGYEDYVKNIQNLGVNSYITTLVGDSIELIENFTDDSVYCVFVDDCHCGNWVTKQLNLWIPKIKKGGLIVGDDCNAQDIRNAFLGKFSDGVKFINDNSGCLVYL